MQYDQSLFTFNAAMKPTVAHNSFTSSVSKNAFTAPAHKMAQPSTVPVRNANVPTMSMNADSFKNGLSQVSQSINQTIDNAAYNFNSIINGNHNQLLATSAGSMQMDHMMQYANAGVRTPSQF